MSAADLKLRMAVLAWVLLISPIACADADEEPGAASIGAEGDAGLGDAGGFDAARDDASSADARIDSHTPDTATSDVPPDAVSPPALPWRVGDTIDTLRLTAWLRAKRYRAWASSTRVTPSAEGGSRVFIDPTLAQALQAQDAPYPVGSVAVRELYADDLVTPRVTNLLIKLDDTGADDGSDWHWFELPADPNLAATTDQRAAPACVACHAPTAIDSIQSRWPLP